MDDLRHIPTCILKLVVLGLLLAMPLSAEQGPVNGTVVDFLTGEPLPGANVVVLGTGIGSVADSEGHFILKQVVSDEFTIRVLRDEMPASQPVSKQPRKRLLDWVD